MGREVTIYKIKTASFLSEKNVEIDPLLAAHSNDLNNWTTEEWVLYYNETRECYGADILSKLGWELFLTTPETRSSSALMGLINYVLPRLVFDSVQGCYYVIKPNDMNHLCKVIVAAGRYFWEKKQEEQSLNEEEDEDIIEEEDTDEEEDNDDEDWYINNDNQEISQEMLDWIAKFYERELSFRAANPAEYARKWGTDYFSFLENYTRHFRYPEAAILDGFYFLIDSY